MKILFATHNKAKLKLYKKGLEGYGIKVLSLDDLNIEHEVEESGNIPSENAYIKAKEYGNIANMITISVDDGLIFDNVPEHVQPGVNVRRINGTSKSDDELIEYYTKIVNRYGKQGRLKGKWIKSIAVSLNKDKVKTHDFSIDKIFVSTPQEKRNIGYPLDSMSLDPVLNKYTVDLNELECQHINDICYKQVFEFVINTINEEE